ncbi:MAG: phosphatidate cytidylyltransferase [Gammaproteobacteria bacterium]|nr:phosphatidate cytidylyltransferase [Gammaproteobacteria bacterium]
MLWQRIMTALIMLPLALFAIFFLPLESFTKVVAVIILIGFWEWTGFIGNISFFSRVAYVLVSAALMWFVFQNSLPIDYWNGWILPESISELFQLRDPAFISLILSALWWVFAFILVIVFPKISENFISNFFIMAVIGWLLLVPTWVALTGLRSIGIAFNFSRGSGLLLFALCLVWAADTGAFVSGKMFGKHKLAPHVSPKKTWEGVLGGVLFATLVSFIAVKTLSINEDKFIGLAILAAIIVSFSVIGDLTESIFKRLSGLKDSGKILPGHGGILDRIDGLTAALPLCLLGFAVLGIN